MTNRDILEVAMQQSAIDANCLSEDFKKSENAIVKSVVSDNARKYLELPLACNLIQNNRNRLIEYIKKKNPGLLISQWMKNLLDE